MVRRAECKESRHDAERHVCDLHAPGTRVAARLHLASDDERKV